MFAIIPTIAPSSGICYVNRVIDGDTLECDRMRVRLCGIDSMEKSQPFGKDATTKLTELALNKNVRLVTNATDVYGRLLAEVWVNNRLLNAEILRAGLGYKYGSCPTQRTVLVDAEKSAIANKLGVWQSEQIRPWTYRKYKGAERIPNQNRKAKFPTQATTINCYGGGSGDASVLPIGVWGKAPMPLTLLKPPQRKQNPQSQKTISYMPA
jgi:micrococcal nuclease